MPLHIAYLCHKGVRITKDYTNEGKNHAEARCIANETKCISKYRIYQLELVVTRTHGENYQESKPCMHCIHIIKRTCKIKKITYSTVAGLVSESVLYIDTSHVSLGNRKGKRI